MQLTEQEIFQKVTEIFIDNLEKEDLEITPETRLDADLLVNSLFLITIIADLERHYKFRFLAEDIQEFKTVGGIVENIKSNITPK